MYPYKAQCRVSHVEELGTDCQIFADFNLESEETISESATKVIAKAAAGTEYENGEVITVSLDLSQIHLFDEQTEESIAPAIPVKTVVPCKVQNGKLGFLGASIELPKAVTAEDGEYDLAIPTSAVTRDGKIEVEYDSEELVNSRRLLHLNLGGTILFAIETSKEVKYAKGEKIRIGVDPKMLSLVKDGETVVAALPETNSLPGKVAKQKVQVTVDGKKKKDIAYTLRTFGTDFSCSVAIGQRLVSGGGQNVFNKELEFVFTPVQATISVDGIPARVERTLDYGEEKFAECIVRCDAPVPAKTKKKKSAETEPEAPAFIEKKVYIAVEKDLDATDVKIALNTEDIAILETEHKIRLV